MTQCAVDERHRLAIAHPDWEGFLVAELTAPSDIERLEVVVDATLQDVIVAHHRAGPIFAGQVVPVDLEVDFSLVRTRAAGAAISGTMHFRDATNTTRELCEPIRLTLACCRFRGCEIADIDDGPLEPEDHEALCAAIIGGSMTPDAAARRIRRAEQPYRRWWLRWR